jgi:AmpE protein
MTFLTMIVALVLVKVWGSDNPLQRDDWFRGLQSAVRGIGFSPTVSFIVYLALPVIVLHLVLGGVGSIMFGLLWIAGSTAILLYSFGRAEFDVLVDRYHGFCVRGDFEAACFYAESELGLETDQGVLSSSREVHTTILRELVYVSYQRWFAVLFYFVVLGPAGALAYRLAQLSLSSPECEQARRLLFYADWIPARLLAGAFALTGDFMGARDELMSSVSEPAQGADTILMSVAQAALGTPELDDHDTEADFSALAAGEVTGFRALVMRSAGAWLVVISLVVVFA